MADLIDRDEAVAAISTLCDGEPRMMWSTDAMDAVKNVRARIKSPTYHKLIRCTCGANKREHWVVPPDGIYLKCVKCGRRSPIGKGEAEARSLWNEMMTEESHEG